MIEQSRGICYNYVKLLRISKRKGSISLEETANKKKAFFQFIKFVD